MAMHIAYDLGYAGRQEENPVRTFMTLDHEWRGAKVSKAMATSRLLHVHSFLTKWPPVVFGRPEEKRNVTFIN